MVNLAKVIRRTLALVVGLGLLTVAVGLAYQPVRDVGTQHRNALTAKPVEATIVDSYATSKISEYWATDTRPSRPSRWSADFVRTRTHYAVVIFEYTVDGKTYTSRNVTPPGAGGPGTYGVDDQDAAEAFASNYQPNETVTAYYPPGKPGEAFLLKQPLNPLYLSVVVVPASLPFVFGVLLVGGGLGLVAPDGSWSSRVGGYLLSLFMLGPTVGVAIVVVIVTPQWGNLPAAALGVLMYGAVLYYTGQMMVLGRSAAEAGLST